MRGLFQAIAAMLRAITSATRTVFVRCARTGAWIAKTIASPFSAPAGAPMEPVIADPVETKPASATGVDRVKKLAVGLASGHAPAALFENMQEQVIEWLGAMDRRMLSVVACARDEDLAAHLSGQQPMRGVLVYDPRAIADYRNAQGLEGGDFMPEPELEQDRRMALAA